MTPLPQAVSAPAPLEVDRIVENPDIGEPVHAVQVRFSEVEHRMLVGDIARRVFQLTSSGQHVLTLLVTAGRTPEGRVDSLERQDALTALMQMLAMPRPSVRLDPQVATALAVALDEAAEEPATCRCGALVDIDGDECGRCVDARPATGTIRRGA